MMNRSRKVHGIPPPGLYEWKEVKTFHVLRSIHRPLLSIGRDGALLYSIQGHFFDKSDYRAKGRSGVSSRRKPSFTTTQWSLILRAGDTADPSRRAALEVLCQRYWYPVYSYVRNRGYDQDSSEDLTQAFFTRLLEKRSLKIADPERGRFRSFLLASVRNFLTDSWDKERAQKRGGGRSIISLDFPETQDRSREPAEQTTPEAVFERRWATSVLTEVLSQLRQEAIDRQALQRFERLEGFLTGELDGVRQGEIAEELGMSVETVRVAVHRLRKRFGKLLREQVAQTVADPEHVDDEIRYLLTILNS